MQTRKPDRALDPYPEKNGARWRLITYEKGKRCSKYYPTEAEARKAKRDFEREQTGPTVRTTEVLIDEWLRYKTHTGHFKEQTAADHGMRLRLFLAPYLERDIGALTARRAAALYLARTVQPSARTGKPLAAATHRYDLATAKSFFNWALKRGHAGENPFAAVEPIGRRNAGKPQLTEEEAQRWVSAGLTLYHDHNDQMALAALLVLFTGARVSEVLRRQVRDLDRGGTVLRVVSGKSKNARRGLDLSKVPWLAEALRQLAADKGPEDYLFGLGRTGKPKHRHLVLAAVRRICKRAEVPRVCTHSLRGFWATAAIENGAPAAAVASALGHGSVEMTLKHYARAEAMANANIVRVADRLGAVLPAELPSPEEIVEMLDEASLARLISLAEQRLTRRQAA